MKIVLLIGCIFMTHLLLSCNPPSGEKARSVHVDSSNIEGDAPVKYGGDDPKDTVARFPEGDDTGKRENTKAEGEQ